jgi:hypothetical protein
LRRKGGRRTRAWVSGQGCHDHGGERLVTAPIDFNRLQLGGEGEPPLAPRLSRPAMEVQLAHHMALVGSRLQRQKHLGASHQTLGPGLTARNLLQAGPLSCGQLPPGGYGGGRRNGGGHTSILAEELSCFWLL